MSYYTGQHVLVSPPMTPMARHDGIIIRRARYGWRVRYDAWGVWLTETVPERCLTNRSDVYARAQA